MSVQPTVLDLRPRRSTGFVHPRTLDLALLALGSGYALLVDWRALPVVVALAVFAIGRDGLRHRVGTPPEQQVRMIVTDQCIQLVRGGAVETVHRHDLGATERSRRGGEAPPPNGDADFRLRFWDRVVASEALRRHGWIGDVDGLPGRVQGSLSKPTSAPNLVPHLPSGRRAA